MNQILDDETEEMAGYVPPVVLRTRPALKMDEDQFFLFCRQNSDLRIERTSRGDIIVMAPTGGWTGSGNARLTTVFTNWADVDGTGRVFDSDTGFRLPNNAVRAPDVSWILNERFDELTREEGEQFPPLCPDFVLELRSHSDRLSDLKAKMLEYLENGARLGWLINPPRKEVFIYRPGKAVEHLENPAELSGEPVLPGFRLELARIWRALGIA